MIALQHEYPAQVARDEPSSAGDRAAEVNWCSNSNRLTSNSGQLSQAPAGSDRVSPLWLQPLRRCRAAAAPPASAGIGPVKPVIGQRQVPSRLREGAPVSGGMGPRQASSRPAAWLSKFCSWFPSSTAEWGQLSRLPSGDRRDCQTSGRYRPVQLGLVRTTDGCQPRSQGLATLSDLPNCAGNVASEPPSAREFQAVYTRWASPSMMTPSHSAIGLFGVPVEGHVVHARAGFRR